MVYVGVLPGTVQLPRPPPGRMWLLGTNWLEAPQQQHITHSGICRWLLSRCCCPQWWKEQSRCARRMRRGRSGRYRWSRTACKCGSWGAVQVMPYRLPMRNVSEGRYKWYCTTWCM